MRRNGRVCDAHGQDLRCCVSIRDISPSLNLVRRQKTATGLTDSVGVASLRAVERGPAGSIVAEVGCLGYFRHFLGGDSSAVMARGRLGVALFLAADPGSVSSQNSIKPPIGGSNPQHIAEQGENRLVSGPGCLPRARKTMAQPLPRKVGC